MNKQLYRSMNNKKIAGVCGGIAEYFNIDPTIVRLVWVLFTLTYGIGFVAYIVAIIIIPEGRTSGFEYKEQQNNTQSQQDYSTNSSKQKGGPDGTGGRVILGAAFVLIGILLLGGYYFSWILRYLWPLIFVIIGVLIIIGGGRSSR